MGKFLGVFRAKIITGQKNQGNGKEKSANGFNFQKQKLKELKNI